MQIFLHQRIQSTQPQVLKYLHNRLYFIPPLPQAEPALDQEHSHGEYNLRQEFLRFQSLPGNEVEIINPDVSIVKTNAPLLIFNQYLHVEYLKQCWLVIVDPTPGTTTSWLNL